MDADLLPIKNLFPKIRQQIFHLISRFNITRARLPLLCNPFQKFVTVDLTTTVQWKLLQCCKRSRYHIRWKMCLQIAPKHLPFQWLLTDIKSVQALIFRNFFLHQYYSFLHRSVLLYRTGYLSELYPVTAKLDLIINPACELHRPIRQIIPQISCPVKPGVIYPVIFLKGLLARKTPYQVFLYTITASHHKGKLTDFNVAPAQFIQLLDQHQLVFPDIFSTADTQSFRSVHYLLTYFTVIYRYYRK
ncbi:hypothetical protein C900_00658 [Fulvivirga imtechensis AK7]|uniref:Uncharacterized protein n=1 Tax=Fulvivirga imtechensis AK7 TaxID=1237149 RepID=L8JLD7_9BACT|nr:hypothetical protein C900_00658 [Fulvivirga imtechensis AK7]